MTEELVLQLDRSTAIAQDDKLSLQDLVTTAGQVACVIGACGLLNILF